MITEVEANSPAAQKDVKPGDVIVEVTQEQVSEPEEVVAQGRRGEEVGPEIGAAADLRRQGRAPLRRRARRLSRQASPVPIKAILIAGPTASGKSGAALELAAGFGGTVINADSMQVYRELRLLTARPSEAEEARAPHRLYGTVSAARSLFRRPLA